MESIDCCLKKREKIGGFDGNCSLILRVLYKIETEKQLDFFISKTEVVGFYLEIRLVYDIIRLLWRFSSR